MLAIAFPAFLALLHVASALTPPKDRRISVSVSAESDVQVEELASDHVAGRIIRRQYDHRKTASTLRTGQESISVHAEGKQLPWTQQNLAHPSLKTSPVVTDPCYVGSFANLVNSSRQSTVIQHNSCLNSLNFDRFTIQVTVLPVDDTPARSYVPLYFSGMAESAENVGISIGEGGSRTSLRVALADGKSMDVKTFPFKKRLPGGHQEVTFGLECFRVNSGRNCKVAINGTIQGEEQHFSNITGNIYNLDGAAFGMNNDWTFTGYLRALQVCPVTQGGGLQATTTTTTWVQNAAKCAGLPVYSQTNKLAMCNDFNCGLYGLVHHSNAWNMTCTYKHSCRDVYDKSWCCRNPDESCTIWMPTMYCAMSEETRLGKYMRVRWPYCRIGPASCLLNITLLIPDDGLYKARAIYACLICSAMLLVLICAYVVWTMIRKLYRTWKVKQLLSWMDEQVFLEVPAKIDAESGMTCRALALELRMLSQNIDGARDFDDFYPEVVILSPLGHREGIDASGCGPGMYHALAVSTVLLKAGVACFSGIMVPPSIEEKEIIDQLSSAESRCKVLIVIQSEALYESWPAAVAIYRAQKHRIHHILPLSFDHAAPDWADQWPVDSLPYSEDTEEFEFLNMRLAVQRHYGVLSALPQAPDTVPRLPAVLEHIAKFVKARLLALLDENQFLSNIPKKIYANMGNELGRIARRLVSGELGMTWEKDCWPEVVLVVAPGQRRGADFSGCGPGLYYALGLTIALVKAGVPCFSRLMCKGSIRKSVDGQVLEKIASTSSRCKLTVVINSAALYSDTGALRQIHAAQEKKVPHVLPLSFGAEIPELKDQWQNINWLDEMQKKIRTDVQARFCKLPSFPPPPATLLDKELGALPKAVEVIKKLVELERKKAAAEEKEKAEEEKKKAEAEQKKASAKADEQAAEGRRMLESRKQKKAEEKRRADQEKADKAAEEKRKADAEQNTAEAQAAEGRQMLEKRRQKKEEEKKQAGLAQKSEQQEEPTAGAEAMPDAGMDFSQGSAAAPSEAAEQTEIVTPRAAEVVPAGTGGAGTSWDVSDEEEASP